MTDPGGFASFDEEDPTTHPQAPWEGRTPLERRTATSTASGRANDWLSAGASGDRAMADFNARGPNKLDAGSLAAQQGALSQLGTAAFGEAPKSLGALQEGAGALPYDQAANGAEHAAHVGVSQAQQLAGKLDVQGQAQQAGNQAGQTVDQEEAKRRLGATVAYGGQGGVMREQADQNARFNASRTGNMTAAVYDAETNAKHTMQQRSDQQTAQAANGAATAAMAVLSLLAVL